MQAISLNPTTRPNPPDSPSTLIQISVKSVSFRVQHIRDTLLTEFSGEAAERGLEFDIEPSDVPLLTDRMLFERIMRNLLGNALRYTPSGRVSVSLAAWQFLKAIT